MNTKLNSTILTIEHIKNVLKTQNENAYMVVMQLVEKPLIEITLEQTRGNQTKAAEILGLNRGTLRTKMKSHSILK
ncbi:helix-turn-helix domain-containing protein [Acinetobacter beijerinckii]|uniref:helix-turn-helix domain-containing protein n=1 Tax=Acinetobacter beijerinckii TaxID=262668 RepID=UPI002404EE76|nr:helix-turn-helix domain-containing protein [Acinetobacter beijerinckii]